MSGNLARTAELPLFKVKAELIVSLVISDGKTAKCKERLKKHLNQTLIRPWKRKER
jgi:hypothetical protein